MLTQRKTLVACAGLPGAGKSSLAHSLAARDKRVAVLDVDVFKQQLVDPELVTDQIDPPAVRWQYYLAALEETCRLLATEAISTVVTDEVFHLRALREKIEGFCAERGVRVLWVEVVCSYELVSQRLATKSRPGHLLSSAETLKMYRLFREVFESFPPGQPNHLLINNQDTLESSVRLVQTRLQALAN